MKRGLDAALLLDKPPGPSSNAALQQARRLLGAAKAGHAGTLDPLASGLLVILFGEATKFAGTLLGQDKEYAATVRLGETTSTGDAQGDVTGRRPVEVTDAAIRAALARFLGKIAQVPPMYSALKRGGVPLYALARRGRSVARAPREIEISELELLGRRGRDIDIRVRCSKGTYVRALAEDIGAALGTGAHLAALRRLASGAFRVEDATGLDALGAMQPSERERRLLPVAALLAGLPRADLEAAAEARFRNGQAVRLPGLRGGVCAVYGSDGSVIGLGEAAPDGALKPLRLVAPGGNRLNSRSQTWRA
jgi:tRNA pseudouridine55 synthase